MKFMDKQKRLVLIILVLLGLGVMLSIGAWLVNRSPLGGQLNKMSALQTEILRINKLADDYQPDPALKQDMANITALVSSDRVAVDAQREKITGSKELPKGLEDEVAVSDAKTRLESASNRGQLAQEYADLVNGLLRDINQLATDAVPNAKSQDLKDLLKTLQEHCEALTNQL